MGEPAREKLLNVIKRSRCHSKALSRYGGGVWVNSSDTAAAQPPVDPAWLAATLSALADTYQVPGAQLAIHRAGTTSAVEVGELEHGTGIPVTRETAFPIGSISKAWTATLAMILVADGDLELDAPLHEHLPMLDDLAGQLTLGQLLSHTSGFACSPDTSELATLSLGLFVREHCRAQDLILLPGTGFSYSNRNYALVGYLIETITGMSWWDAMESILLRPLGIDLAAIVRTMRVLSGRSIATGHSANSSLGRTVPVKQSLALAEAPAGALAMSAVDLVALGLMHVGQGFPDLLPASYAGQMRQAVPVADPFGLADGWGLGLAVFRDGTNYWVGHDGNANGTSCYLRIEPANKWVVALTTNANTGSDLWDALCTKLRPPSLPLAAHRRDLRPQEPIVSPKECAGSYSNGAAIECHVTAAADGNLYLANGNELCAQFAFCDDLVFLLQDPITGRRINAGRFVRDSITRQVDQILICGRIAKRQPLPAASEALSSADSLSCVSASVPVPNPSIDAPCLKDS